MSKARRLLTNWTKGELSPLLEGRPDLAAYFEGAKELTNWLILRQGGVTRRYGTRFVAEVKNSALDTIILPFEFSVDVAFVIEMGNQYARFYKNQAPVLTSAGGPPVEVATPYLTADLREIHFTQSADVLFLFHGDYAQRSLNHVTDTDWSLAQIAYKPPPSFVKDTDISGGTVTLTPAATTGTSIVMTASGAVFLEADVGRTIIAGSARATITGFGASAGDVTSPNTRVRADILSAFATTSAIAAGGWLLHLSPQTALDPNIKEPVGAQVTMTSPVPAFRAADVGKFIEVYGGLVQITVVDSVTQVRGEILSVMGDATAGDPAAAPKGAWTLEVASWSAINGYPRTGEIYQGRLGQAGTAAQPNTVWLSASDDYINYAIGVFADNALEYTVAARQVNRIEWLGDNIDLFIGTSGAEMRMQGGGPSEPLGGDKVPLVTKLTPHGEAPIQPVIINRRTLFIDRSRKKLFALGYEITEDDLDTTEVTAQAEHIFGDLGVSLGAIAFQKRPDPRLYFKCEDGALATLTYYLKEKVVGFTRLITDGLFQSVTVIPGAAGKSDQVYVVVLRTINDVPKRYIEVMEPNAPELSGRLWPSLQTDCAVIYSGSATTTITGLDHLEGKTVDVVADGSARPAQVVVGGQITLEESATVVEVGLHYDSPAVSMRPSIEGAMIEGLPRSWDKLWLRLHETIGGTVNGSMLQYAPSPLDELRLFTGDKDVTGQGWDDEGRISFSQTQPYPMTVLAAFGELSVGDRG